jgi:bacterial/archaeal transporter family-2 protein
LVYSLYHRRRRAAGVRRRHERTILTVLFTLNAFFFAGLLAVLPRPLPTIDGISAMPWWAPLAGLTGAVAVFAGLALIDKIGAGPG